MRGPRACAAAAASYWSMQTMPEPSRSSSHTPDRRTSSVPAAASTIRRAASAKSPAWRASSVARRASWRFWTSTLASRSWTAWVIVLKALARVSTSSPVRMSARAERSPSATACTVSCSRRIGADVRRA